MYKKLKEPVHKWPKVLAMKDCAIKCIDAATNECPVSCPLSHSSPLSLAQSAASAPWPALGPSCIVLQIDFVARLQDRQRQRQRQRRLLAKRGQQFAKQHCAYMPTTKLFGIFCLCCHWFIGLPSAHTAKAALATVCSSNSTAFELYITFPRAKCTIKVNIMGINSRHRSCERYLQSISCAAFPIKHIWHICYDKRLKDNFSLKSTLLW